MDFDQLTHDLFARFPAVRYVAVYMGGEPRLASRADLQAASAGESDRYEEIIVNPALLKIAQQRGNIDCGGLEYLIVRYGNFFQYVSPLNDGHVSICIQADADPLDVGGKALRFVRERM